MIVKIKDAEKNFYQNVKEIKLSAERKLCFYAAFSQSGIDKDVLLEEFLLLLQNMPNSYVAQVFVCHDKDIMVLAEGFMRDPFQKFFEKFMADLNLNTQFLFEIIDTQESFARLFQLAEDKVNLVNKIDMEASRNAQNKRFATIETLSEINPSILMNIAATRANRDQIKVMVADDDQISRTLISNAIDKAYQYSFAKTGREALSVYVDQAPDVLFLDIGMPDISGHDVLESIFQVDPEAYIIMFSGRKDKGNIQRALELGAQGFLGKPFTREELRSYIIRSPFVEIKMNNKEDAVAVM